MTTPPPSPVNDPKKPATIEPSKIGTVKTKLFIEISVQRDIVVCHSRTTLISSRPCDEQISQIYVEPGYGIIMATKARPSVR